MDKYGLLGYPLKHSFSYKFFSEKFEKEYIQAVYLNFEIPEISSFPNILRENPELKGLNVTIPYKELVMSYLDEVDDDAASIGAVNVVKFIDTDEGLKLKGYNSDIIGFQESIHPLLDREIHKRALVLGTGGASKAIVRGLFNEGVDVRLVSRQSKNGCFIYEDLDENVLQEYTVIVNASPVGTFPNVDDCPAIPYQYLTPNHLLYDVVYNPNETIFLRKGREYGAVTKNGAEMLKLQAIASWEIWNNIK